MIGWNMRGGTRVTLMLLVLAFWTMSAVAKQDFASPSSVTSAATGTEENADGTADKNDPRLSFCRRWIRHLEVNGRWQGLPKLPRFNTAEQQQAALVFGALHLGNASQRMSALKLLCEAFREKNVDSLKQVLADSNDPEIQQTTIYLLGLLQPENLVDAFVPFLESSRPELRAAATEGLGLQRNRRWLSWSPPELILDTSPPIKLGWLDRTNRPVFRRSKLPADLTRRLQTMMIQDPDPGVRQAAARSLIVSPPNDYQFRYAEWGVWIQPEEGPLRMTELILDEIPDFVHRTQTPLASFEKHFQYRQFVDKPVVHMTVDQPLAVQLQVSLFYGQPWFAYPKPDADFVDVRQRSVFPGKGLNQADFLKAEFSEFQLLWQRDPEFPTALMDPLYGYPFMIQSRPRYGSTDGGMGAEYRAEGLGLRWQNLILSNRQPSAERLPDTGNNPLHQWWKDLRQVPSSWVQSENETERFLYYDGPTLCRAPSQVEWKDNDQIRLSFSLEQWGRKAENRFEDPVRAMAIRLTPDGNLVGQQLTLAADQTVMESKLTWDIPASQVESAFLEMLQQDAGLTVAEGKGLLDAWRKAFLETPGQRLLVRLPSYIYDQFCPLEIAPYPTERVRVGLIWHELPH